MQKIETIKKRGILRYNLTRFRSVFIILLLLALMTGTAQAESVARIKVSMAIGPIAADIITEAVNRANEEGRDLLIIELDTPGGLDKSMRIICRKLLNTEQPVAVYVAPSGARAASAGLFIAYSAHIAAMAPGTNIGAAHSVNLGGQMDSVMTDKVQNDAVAYITSIAKKRGRNVEWATRAVLESVSIDAQAAVDSNIVDYLARDLPDLLEKIDGRPVEVNGRTDTLHLAGADIVEYDIGLKDRILEVITDPTIAFILFNIGWLGLMIELYNPGAILPGIVGGISLVLAFFAFQQLPINYAGLALIIFAVVLFALEVKIVSHGLLGLGGVLSLLIGSFLLIDSPEPYMQISVGVIITTVIAVTVFFFIVVGFAIRAHRKKVTTGQEGIVGDIGEVRDNGMIFVAGELWRADCDQPLASGDKIRVTEVHGMRLKVDKIGGE